MQQPGLTWKKTPEFILFIYKNKQLKTRWRMRARTGTAWPGLCLQHLCSQRPAEAEAAAPGPAQHRQARCATQPLHPPSQLLRFSVMAPGHEIQPLTWPLCQTGVGKPGPVLPSTGAHTLRASQQVSHAHLSLQLSPVKRNFWSTRRTRRISRPPSVLCTPSIGFSSPRGACSQTWSHLPLQWHQRSFEQGAAILQ